MQVFYLQERCKVSILIDSESDVYTVKCEDFLMEIFSYYDNTGKKLFTAKQSDVEVFATEEVYQFHAKKRKSSKNTMKRLLIAGIQGY